MNYEEKINALESSFVEQQGQLKKLLDCQEKLATTQPSEKLPVCDASLRLAYEFACPAFIEPIMVLFTIKQSEENTSRQVNLIKGSIANICEKYCTRNQSNGCSNSLSS